nr:hypothetical protein BaRGS_019867 [Batillaria attramentaria]
MDANSSSSELGHPAAPAGCLLLLTQDFVPWDNPHNLIGMEFARLVSRAKACYILPVLFLVGFPTNCINMAVFYRQGSKSFLSARATAAIIVTAFVVILGGYVIVLFRYDTICVYNPITNATTIEVSQTSEFYRENKELVNQLDNVGRHVEGRDVILHDFRPRGGAHPDARFRFRSIRRLLLSQVSVRAVSTYQFSICAALSPK